MRILFDQGVLVPLRRELPEHGISTAFEQRWSALSNGLLLSSAEEAGFESMITTDKNLRYQQNLADRRVAILVLPTTRWPVIERHTLVVKEALKNLRSGEYRELSW
ncbi:hypothetical protein GC207_08975 [bacterium]|nr:hypothetical protein [bacterium]